MADGKMLLDAAYVAIGACLVLAVMSSLFATASAAASDGKATPGILESFLLAGGRLKRWPIVSLLLSSAFALNGLFYQVWLGYSIGIWGLITQVAWMISYWLLMPQTSRIRDVKSLHDLLGSSFGPSARMIAALCSILGFMAMMGWEVAISRETFGDILVSGHAVSVPHREIAGAWLSGLTVFTCLIYTVYGGLRGNAIADIFQNFAKLAGFILVTVLLFFWLFESGHNIADYWHALCPPLNTMVRTLGWLGLITNIIFSLCWQFVDASTWQSILASRREPVAETRSSLFWGGVTTLAAPGLLGTVLGATLHFSSGITADNVLFKAIEFVGTNKILVMCIVFFAIACCVMSFLDGLLLASGYALVIDIFHPRSTLAELDANQSSATSTLIVLRVILTCFAIFAAWGVHALVKTWGINLFDFVYLAIIPQLAIFGPVIVALLGRVSRWPLIAFVIAVAFASGIAATLLGQTYSMSYLSDGAGTLTTFISLVGAYLVSTGRGLAT